MKTKPVRFRDRHPRPAEVVKKERMKLLKQFQAAAMFVGLSSWRNHSCYVAVNKKGETRKHHRARTEPEKRRIRARRRQLQTTTLKSLALAQAGKSSSPKWQGVR